ncbi:hypothetical protein DM01DRAFT_350494 [Hesseltinella vesiculosa]|uniref:Fe2OG dioxygenase domain-containing protein n=1 Tax=Hesseltinella vesiculosa TaxID=101127 RepID=A0A1X2GEV6_9FUNG|nr:hypothetical protein DM01DRAFT_350494 [Hesseltinella vesiculosa]
MGKAKKVTTKQTPSKTSTASPSNHQPPTLPKLIAKSALSVTELEPQQIYLIHDFFTPKECQQLIAYFDKHLTPQAAASLVPKPGEAFRSNDRQSLQSSALANQLWQLGLARVCTSQQGIAGSRQPCGLNSNIRIYRYRPGQRFEAHYDDSVKDDITGYWTEWTLLIYLNGDMQGGETVFYKEGKKKKNPPPPIVVQPQQGLALLHRHGQHCLLHEALEVTGGAKWVLRSDVLMK